MPHLETFKHKVHEGGKGTKCFSVVSMVSFVFEDVFILSPGLLRLSHLKGLRDGSATPPHPDQRKRLCPRLHRT